MVIGVLILTNFEKTERNFDMTKKEKLKTQKVIAIAIGVNLANIRIIYEKKSSLCASYLLENFKGFNLLIKFKTVPAIVEVREQIKDLYLCGVEWDFDEEMRAI